jgi:recombination protein RecA
VKGQSQILPRILERRGSVLPTGVADLDAAIRGFPRGAISEVVGPETSGRATLLNSILAQATTKLEICAYVDANDVFDPLSAANGGVDLARLLWVRCGGNIEHALKAVDCLLHAGGFGVVALDLASLPLRVTGRIPSSYWYRFRRAADDTEVVLSVVSLQAVTGPCASLRLELKARRTIWRGSPEFLLLRGLSMEAMSQRPFNPQTTSMTALASFD